MPYITDARRIALDVPLPAPETAGELNYCITRLLIGWVGRKGMSYDVLDAARSAAHGAAVEFERRVLARYEDRKVIDNGDVYPDWMLTT